MGEIAYLTKNKKDAKDFKDTSKKYMKAWEKYAFEKNATHAKLAYQLSESWGSLYNAYADDVLGLGLFPDHVRAIQDKWYYKKTDKYGLPLDSRHTYTKSDWEMFIAAISTKDTRNLLIDKLALWINETSTGALVKVPGSNIVDRPFTDLYDTIGTGGFPGPTFINRPVVGGHFALLALDRAQGLRKGKSFSLQGGQKLFRWGGSDEER